MCDRCAELDEKIAHLQLLSGRITDRMTREAIAFIVAEYEAQKRQLHPEASD